MQIILQLVLLSNLLTEHSLTVGQLTTVLLKLTHFTAKVLPLNHNLLCFGSFLHSISLDLFNISSLLQVRHLYNLGLLLHVAQLCL